jgi:putative ATP-dependent endonuclease of the OLD family
VLKELHVHGFRSARDVVLRPTRVCALVGDAGTGKSNLLVAIWKLLDPGAPPPAPDDASEPGGTIEVTAVGGDGSRIALRARPPASAHRRGAPPPVVFLPARLRAETLVARAEGRVGRLLAAAGDAAGGGRSAAAGARVAAVESSCHANVRGVVLLIEEPELYLRPQAQRYLYRLLHSFAEQGNQVFYSTHSPAFLSVSRLEELVLVGHREESGTTVFQPHTLAAGEAFRALSEFDADRSELFLSRATLLVEGRTEKLVFPFVFLALGHDPDREAISIVECGGKPNIAVVARVCEAARIPYFVVHDRDAPAGREPIAAERTVNREIALVAGADRIVELVPDFEYVAGLQSHSHKPEHAWRRFVDISPQEIPAPLVDVAERVLALARG